MRNHWNSERHHNNAHPKCELFPVRSQYFWPVIHHTGDKRFYDAEFAVNSKDLEREDSPLNNAVRNRQRVLLTSNSKERFFLNCTL